MGVLVLNENWERAFPGTFSPSTGRSYSYSSFIRQSMLAIASSDLLRTTWPLLGAMDQVLRIRHCVEPLPDRGTEQVAVPPGADFSGS